MCTVTIKYHLLLLHSFTNRNATKWNVKKQHETWTCVQTPVHTRTCVCCKCQSYVSIKYEAIVRHIQFIMIVIILIYCMNEQMRLKKSTWLKNDRYQYLLAQTCSLLIKITHGLFCSRLTFLCTTKNAMFWMLIIMWSHLMDLQLFESEPQSVHAVDL